MDEESPVQRALHAAFHTWTSHGTFGKATSNSTQSLTRSQTRLVAGTFTETIDTTSSTFSASAHYELPDGGRFHLLMSGSVTVATSTFSQLTAIVEDGLGLPDGFLMDLNNFLFADLPDKYSTAASDPALFVAAVLCHACALYDRLTARPATPVASSSRRGSHAHLPPPHHYLSSVSNKSKSQFKPAFYPSAAAAAAAQHSPPRPFPLPEQFVRRPRRHHAAAAAVAAAAAQNPVNINIPVVNNNSNNGPADNASDSVPRPITTHSTSQNQQQQQQRSLVASSASSAASAVSAVAAAAVAAVNTIFKHQQKQQKADSKADVSNPTAQSNAAGTSGGSNSEVDKSTAPIDGTIDQAQAPIEQRQAIVMDDDDDIEEIQIEQFARPQPPRNDKADEIAAVGSASASAHGQSSSNSNSNSNGAQRVESDIERMHRQQQDALQEMAEAISKRIRYPSPAPDDSDKNNDGDKDKEDGVAALEALHAAAVGAAGEASTEGRKKNTFKYVEPLFHQTRLATSTLMKQISMLQKTDTRHDGFTAEPTEDNLYIWKVKFFFDDKTESPLAADLSSLQSHEAIELEFRFPAEYPYVPPMVRVVAPFIVGGHVAPHGGICMELLTTSGWAPVNSIESVCIQVRTMLLHGNARIDFKRLNYVRNYTFEGALMDMRNIVRIHRWDTAEPKNSRRKMLKS